MGEVYLAEDTQLVRRVALKVPHIATDAAPTVLERFYREARAAAALRRVSGWCTWNWKDGTRLR
jgi:serine/threonine protein kinase